MSNYIRSAALVAVSNSRFARRSSRVILRGGASLILRRRPPGFEGSDKSALFAPFDRDWLSLLVVAEKEEICASGFGGWLLILSPCFGIILCGAVEYWKRLEACCERGGRLRVS